ncbi:hypothetical protein B0T17DRAFT_481975 [Bombardia bombarda]|uniref:Uncharacterized protein n=1 Tax=Bombardia bombarda TaxID=252184 RepID=A0AA39XHV4_9PEZI|nr:hypothetical protein B0T17DRAFT_481975 [Bombardia bombarda]
MIPLVEDAVLQNNPGFAALYNTLTTVILNPDASTKNDPAAKERNAVRKELDEYRQNAAKQHLLTHAITTANPSNSQNNPIDNPKPTSLLPAASSRRAAKSQQIPLPQSRRDRASSSISTDDDSLPPALHDLLILLPPLLSTSQSTTSSLSPESASLLLSTPPLSLFPSLLPPLAALVSSSLHSSAVHLARIANPTTNPSFIHRTIPSLPAYVASLTTAIADLKASITRARLAATTTLTTGLLSRGTQALLYLLRTLEAKHGAIARSLEFRAAEVALTAQRQEKEAELGLWQARRDTYTEDAVRALRNYAGHLRDGQARLREKVRSLRAELEGYGVTAAATGGGGGGDRNKERTMREMAKVYKEMMKQVEEVRVDLERLGRA